MKEIELVLFEHELEKVKFYAGAGITSFLIDLEVIGKDARQLGFDTEINPGALEDLGLIHDSFPLKKWCRLNRFGEWTDSEIDRAISNGADVLILPMVRDLPSVENFLRKINSRCQACIMFETRESVALANSIKHLPVDYAYFGLNDYRIDTGSSFLFQPIFDGTIEALRAGLPSIKFGFGGLTDMNKGFPVPSICILEELERLDCDFVFLRRSFKRDSLHRPAGEIVDGILGSWAAKRRRSNEERARDHQNFKGILGSIVQEMNTGNGN